MPRFEVTIPEHWKATVIVEAETAEAATQKCKDAPGGWDSDFQEYNWADAEATSLEDE